MGKGFSVLVVMMVVLAITYFVGNFLSHGHPFLSHVAQQTDPKLAQLLPATETAPAEAVAVAAAVPTGPIIGDATRGAAQLPKCKACHTFDQGGKNMIGPNLWGTFNGKIMHVDGFTYSSAFQAKAGLVWTEENLDAFLANPKAFVPGTKMAFPGIKDAQARADLVAHLKTLR
mgnify:CR=1 FL=1